jgi:glycosyltransferase involved in cell wall biosynthesis
VAATVGGMTARPRLLFLCQTLPYPPDGGVWIRTFHVLRLLSRAFEITALCFERAGSAGRTAPLGSSVSALERFAKVEAFRVPPKHSRRRFVWDHARSLARRRVYTHYLYDSRAFAARLEAELAATRFDLVHVDSLDLARYIPACAGVPVACVHHDVESDLLRRRAGLEPSGLRRWYLGRQSELMREVERRWCGAIALNVAVSDHDRTRLLQLAPDARVVVVPNGVDTAEFAPVPGEPVEAPTGIAFVGGTQPSPNLDALEYFCTGIKPHLGTELRDVPVRWIGRASAEQQRHYRDRYGVELSGYLDDVRPLMRAAAVHIVPLRIGGGTRLKILNAWAMGKPVVSTSIGCEGLAAVDGENVLVRDDPRRFAMAIARVLGSPELQKRLGGQGRDTVRQRYDWDAVGTAMLDTYLSLTQTGARSTAPSERSVHHAVSCLS